MRNLARSLAVLLVAALSTRGASGYPRDWGPFESGAAPRRFAVTECSPLDASGPETARGPDGRPGEVIYGRQSTGPQLHAIVDGDQFEIAVAVTTGNGRVLAPRRRVSESFVRPDTSWCADFNGDRQLDFALPLRSTGNGLGASFSQLIVALSSASTYRIWVVPTAEPGTEDFLLVGDPRRRVIVKTGFAMSDQPNPDRRHSYWVYHLLVVRGDELMVANDIDPRFPKWVWYAGTSNHKPARSLTRADKARIWGQQPEPMFWEAPAVVP